MAYSSETVAWATSFNTCWRCGRRGVWPHTLSIHHFVRGSSRNANDLKTTAITCDGCHEDEHGRNGIGMIGWLVLKRRFDKEHFDLAAVCRAHHRSPGSITVKELDEKERVLAVSGDLPYTLGT